MPNSIDHLVIIGLFGGGEFSTAINFIVVLWNSLRDLDN